MGVRTCPLPRPQKMFTSKMLTSSLLLCSFLPLVFSCSCVSYTRSRSLAICNDYSSESSIYKARITASQCKCNLDSSTDRFSCIDTRQYSNGSLAGSVQGLYECGNSSSSTFPYSSCRNVINSLGISKWVISHQKIIFKCRLNPDCYVWAQWSILKCA